MTALLPPGVKVHLAFGYTDTRKGIDGLAMQVDGYAGFERLTARGDIVLAACWAHARRKFYDVQI